MVINTIFGYNALGRYGPAASSPVFALDLDEVSTIVPGGGPAAGATRQLTLNDLGTDCPQSEDPSVIATKAPDGRCDPSLVAPAAVRSWALPCNACGRLGLFDPPYAIPALSGGLVPTTAVTTPVEETTPAPAPTTTTTTTPAATGATSTTVAETTTTTAAAETSSTEAVSSAAGETSTAAETTASTPVTTPVVITSGSTTITSTPGSVPTTVATASAARTAGGFASLVLGFLVSMSLLM
ncbi:hypothetical protein Hte_009820 [Hypoxylon texense]